MTNTTQHTVFLHEDFRYSGFHFECTDRSIRIDGRIVGVYRVHANLTEGIFVPNTGVELTDSERDAIYQAIKS